MEFVEFELELIYGRVIFKEFVDQFKYKEFGNSAKRVEKANGSKVDGIGFRFAWFGGGYY